MSSFDAPRIWVPKMKIYEAGLEAPTGRVEGRFVLEACNRYGQPRRRLEWRQLITDWGMGRLVRDLIGTTIDDMHRSAQVGTGTVPFGFSSTDLTSPIGPRTTTRASGSAINTMSTDPLEGYRHVRADTFEFPLGAIEGNLTEVGIFSNTTGSNGTFLDLIRDSEGNPTTFPVTAEDQLRVTHVVHIYPFLGTTEGSFLIGGSAGSGQHDYECSMSALNRTSGYTLMGFRTDGGSWGLRAFVGATSLGTVEQDHFPGATLLSGNAPSSSNVTITDDEGVWTATTSNTMGLTDYNHLQGLSGLKMYSADRRAYKFFIDPPIPKFAGSVQRILTLHFSTSAARREE